MTDKEKQQSIVDGILDLWDDYKQNGITYKNEYQFTDIKHDELMRLGLMTETKGEARAKLIKQAEDEWKAFLEHEELKAQSRNDRPSVAHFREVLHNFAERLREPATQKMVIAKRCKIIKLKAYFEQLKKDGKDLHEILDINK